MPGFYKRMKFIWDYFARGRHRGSRSGQTQQSVRLPKLDVHSDSLVGEYVRTAIGTWWADATIAGLNHKVRLVAPGHQPASEQLMHFKALVERLPALRDASKLEPAPRDDGWGHFPPPFDIHSAPIKSITLQTDGGYFVLFEVDPEDVYMMASCFEISSDLELISAEWSV